MTKTSQPATGDYVAYFTQLLQEGKDVLHVCLSSGLSGDINSATLAGHNSLRERVMGYENRPATQSEMQAMRDT